MNLPSTLVALSLITQFFCYAETTVRVRQTPGGPQIFVDERPVRPRWFFGVQRGSGLHITQEWTEHAFDFTPSAPVDRRGTLHFRFGQQEGDIWLSDVRVFDAESDEDILPTNSFSCSAGFADAWNVWPLGDANTVGKVSVEQNALHVELTDPSSREWPDFHLHSDIAMSFKAGRRYRCAFRTRAIPDRRITPAIHRVEGGVWTHIGGPPGPFLNQVAIAREAGVRFISFDAPNCWRPPEGFADFSALDEACQRIIDIHPTALLVPRVSMNAPPWWLQRHPEARMVYEDDRLGRIASISHRAYRADAAAHLEALCLHLCQRFPEHFAGVHPCGQNTGEWFYEGSWEASLSGYDPAARDAWHDWLRTRGIAEADIPSPVSRHAAPHGLLRDPAKESHLIEFSRFQQEEMADMVLALASAARRGTDSKKLVLLFYGYHYEFGALPNGAPVSGHYALGKVLQSSDIDILCSPISYTDRAWPGTAPCMSPAESIRDAGILWLNEDDTRTYLSSQKAYGAVENLEQTQDVMLRNTAQASLRGFATWWMDLMGEGWFVDDAIWDVIRQLGTLDEAMLKRGQPFTPDIAAIIGEDSMCHLAGRSHILARPLIYDARAALGRSGAPYGQYTLTQALGAGVSAKLRFYLAAWSLTFSQQDQLAQARRPGQTRVWCYAPGYLGPDGTNIEAMNKVTGFVCRKVTPDTAVATPTEMGRELGLTEPWGLNTGIEPLFAVEAAPEEQIATYPDGNTAVAVRATDQGTDVFVGVPQLTPMLVRALARIAGVHLFADGTASVWVADPYLSVHALADGIVTLHTGRAGVILDALNGSELGDGPDLPLQMRRGETRVIRY